MVLLHESVDALRNTLHLLEKTDLWGVMVLVRNSNFRSPLLKIITLLDTANLIFADRL